MNQSYYIGAIGLRAQQGAVDAVSNNLANINTASFKRVAPVFSELRGASASSTPQVLAFGETRDPALSGVQIDISNRSFAQGELRPTGNPLDLAIRGTGFIEVLGQDGQIFLSRGGQLKINEDGYLSLVNGMPLKAMVNVPREATEILISESGKILANVGGQSTELGAIELISPKDTRNLIAHSDSLYRPDDSTREVIQGEPGHDGLGLLAQGHVESSNVQLSDELVTLMLMQRAYAASAKVVQAGDELMGIANGLKR